MTELRDPNEIERLITFYETKPDHELYYFARYARFTLGIEDELVRDINMDFLLDWLTDMHFHRADCMLSLRTLIKSF
tara:strand:- start:165 stop:395 length:231 start_codon:yes stop_codon:yes gene_type:complete